ncbi:pinin/SDK/memA/ protein conserved region-domain-containing protein [Xylariaceae sp. FL0662B]|nr:pinin/SDK/memA/ protein conserved region-domain-containing protein [Xylariaceae sp. FL0662B]
MSDPKSSPNGRGPERDTAIAETERDQDNAQKRKASSPSPTDGKPSQSPKRTRLDRDAKEDPSTRAQPTPKDSGTDRRESALQEERKRGKRLFGGLLSTLSQTTSSSQQKRRQEIERRQQAKVHQQKAEDEKHREEKLAKLRAVRKVEQLKFDEQVMRTRHSNMLAIARFLETRSRPKIYYLPWDPTEEQEDIIKNQIRDVQDVIDKEVHDFKRRKEQKLKVLGIAVTPPLPEPKETVGKADDDERPTDLPKSNSTNRTPSHTRQAGHEKESDRADDVMIEEDEDTVIY